MFNAQSGFNNTLAPVGFSEDAGLSGNRSIMKGDGHLHPEQDLPVICAVSALI